MATPVALGKKLGQIWPHLNERSRRMLAAAEAVPWGYGGGSLVSRLCGLARGTLNKGIGELGAASLPAARRRRPGGGRWPVTRQDPHMLALLETLLEPGSRGDPETPLRWTCKSTRALAAELTRRRHPIRHEKVAPLLRALDYSLHGNRKTLEGQAHADRDAQFQHRNREVRRALRHSQPVLSVATKQQELVGNDRHAGRQGRRRGTPERVRGHDFPGPKVPRAYPYGIYDLGRNRGFVNVGTDHDTAAFAVASIRGWWRAEGRRLYPAAPRRLLTADGGEQRLSLAAGENRTPATGR